MIADPANLMIANSANLMIAGLPHLMLADLSHLVTTDLSRLILYLSYLIIDLILNRKATVRQSYDNRTTIAKHYEIYYTS